MSRPIPFPDTVPKVLDQPVSFLGLFDPRPLNIGLFGTLPGYENDIDNVNQPEATIR